MNNCFVADEFYFGGGKRFYNTEHKKGNWDGDGREIFEVAMVLKFITSLNYRHTVHLCLSRTRSSPLNQEISDEHITLTLAENSLDRTGSHPGSPLKRGSTVIADF